MGLMSEELKVDFLGHQLVARLSVFSGGKLYIDGKMVDSIPAEIFSSNKVAMLRGGFSKGKKNHIVEVYQIGRLNKRLAIYVDGSEVAAQFKIVHFVASKLRQAMGKR